jgi:hypothetical protein
MPVLFSLLASLTGYCLLTPSIAVEVRFIAVFPKLSPHFAACRRIMKDKKEIKEFWLFVRDLAVFLILGTLVYILLRWYIYVSSHVSAS